MRRRLSAAILRGITIRRAHNCCVAAVERISVEERHMVVCASQSPYGVTALYCVYNSCRTA